MSSVLYYSNFCENCKNLLQKLSKTDKKKEIHFLCIDKRVKKNNGATYIVLNNGQEILLPPTITKVPALLLLNQGHHVLFGNDIDNHLRPLETDFTHQAQSPQNVAQMSEPEAFSINSNSNMTNVSSDNFSFLDQSAESLTAKGDGGLRQLHNYVTLDQKDIIETPPDTYAPDKIGSVSLENLQLKRNEEMNKTA
jgi:hypothetical protein